MFALQNLVLRSARRRVSPFNECKHWEDYLFPFCMFFWVGIWLQHLKNILLLYKTTVMETWSSPSLWWRSAAKVCSCKASVSRLLLGYCAWSMLGLLCGVCFEMVDPGLDISAFSWKQPLSSLRHPERVMNGLILKRCWELQHIPGWYISAAHSSDPKPEPHFPWRFSSPPTQSVPPS